MIVDSSVLVDIDRGVEGAAERAARLDVEGRHAVSAVTVTELEYGARRGRGASTMLAAFDVLPVTEAVARQAAQLMVTLERKGKSLGDLHDVYIAATALRHGLPVLTANVRHFDRVPRLKVVDWGKY